MTYTNDFSALIGAFELASKMVRRSPRHIGVSTQGDIDGYDQKA